MDTNRFKSSHDFSNVQKKSAKEVWEEIQEIASEAWGKNKDHSNEKKIIF